MLLIALVLTGGNGISSAASVFTELAAAAVATPGLPCLLVWASRSAAELETMGPLVLAMARALQLQLTTKLFFTGLPCKGGLLRSGPRGQQLGWGGCNSLKSVFQCKYCS